MLKDWITAFRPRTLFLATASVILGSGLALHEGVLSTHTFVWAFLLAACIQILSNLANDLGDYQKGTDTSGKRVGPVRATQSGKITAQAMKTAIGIFTLLSLLSGTILVLATEAELNSTAVIVMLAIGALCVAAALLYTLGKYAYGYRGWGDFFAFLFFGPVPVIGTYFLHTGILNFQPVLPAIGLGLISTMVLNINNMRDIENDRTSGKKTMAVRLGLANAKLYHTLLTFSMATCFIAYNYIYAATPWQRYLYLLVFVFQFYILTQIHTKTGRQLDPYLKLTAISGLLMAVGFVACINL